MVEYTNIGSGSTRFKNGVNVQVESLIVHLVPGKTEKYYAVFKDWLTQ